MNIARDTADNIDTDNGDYVRTGNISAAGMDKIYDKMKDLAKESNENSLVKSHMLYGLEYDTTLNQTNTHNIYGAFVENQVVCEGYAKAFKYIMDDLNIECILVSGVATNSSGKEEAHMWNYVKLNDSWYGIDVTWDDPIINGGTYKNNLRHDYFLKGYYTFIESHMVSGKISESGMLFSLPTLSSSHYKW